MANPHNFRRRQSARVLVVSPMSRVLLFRFIYKDGPLAGSDYWATPGGELKAGESYEAAAIRELYEETGIKTHSVGLPIADKEFLWQMPDGEIVVAVEKYFIVETEDEALSQDGWTPNEIDLIFESRWWSKSDLKSATAMIWPNNIVELLMMA